MLRQRRARKDDRAADSADIREYVIITRAEGRFNVLCAVVASMFLVRLPFAPL